MFMVMFGACDDAYDYDDMPTLYSAPYSGVQCPSLSLHVLNQVLQCH